MALRLTQVEPADYVYVCTPTGDEMPDMVAHWARLGTLLGGRILPLTTGLSLSGLIAHYDALPNWRQRWCTRQLKIEPFQAFVLSHRPAVVFVGLRADEEEREGAVYGEIEGVTQRFPLREWGWSRAMVEAYLEGRGIDVPVRTDCARCFYQTLAEWWWLWKLHPDTWAEAEAQELATGHTFRSPGRDSWPAGLRALRERFERGEKPRGVERQLGIFDRGIRDRPCRVCSL